MNGFKTGLVTIGMLVCFSVASASASAGVVVGPVTLEGPHLLYTDITQTSTTDPLESFGIGDTTYGPYGEPTLSGDALDFVAPYFSSFVFPGPGVDITDGFLTYGLRADVGMTITNLDVFEFGSISLFSPLGGSTLTAVQVSAPAFVTINEVLLNDGTATGQLVVLDTPVTLEEGLAIGPPGNSLPGWDAQDDPDVSSWDGAASLDLNQAVLADNPTIDDQYPLVGATDIQFSMNNTLTAVAEDNFASAFIDKKRVSIRPTLAVVPEPMTLAMLIAAGWLVPLVRRHQ